MILSKFLLEQKDINIDFFLNEVNGAGLEPNNHYILEIRVIPTNWNLSSLSSIDAYIENSVAMQSKLFYWADHSQFSRWDENPSDLYIMYLMDWFHRVFGDVLENKSGFYLDDEGVVFHDTYVVLIYDLDML